MNKQLGNILEVTEDGLWSSLYSEGRRWVVVPRGNDLGVVSMDKYPNLTSVTEWSGLYETNMQVVGHIDKFIPYEDYEL